MGSQEEVINHDDFHGEEELKELLLAESDVEESKTHVYKRRWYILLVFGLYAATQNLVWNTWGPISTTAEEAFGWSDATIATLSNWGPVAYIISGVFFPWFLQVKGLRVSVVISMLLVAVGTLMRILSFNPHTLTKLFHAGQCLNGFAGPIGMGAVSKISATWFPPGERITATAIGSSMGVLGAALAFLTGPYFVSSQIPPRKFSYSIDLRKLPHTDRQLSLVHLKNSTIKEIIQYRHRQQDVIWEYMLFEFLWSAVLTFVVLGYFPALPPKPPCLSAVSEREEYWAGMKAIWRNGPFLAVAFTYGISLGVLGVWGSVLNINLSTVGISQQDSGQLGFHSIWIGCAASLVIGRFADWFNRRMKMFIIILYLAASLAFAVFLATLTSSSSFSTGVIWLTVITGSTLLNAATPLLFELACELVYPIGEATPNGIMAYINNLAGIVFLTVFAFPNVGTMWMNWTLVLATVGCVPLMVMLQEKYHRLALETPVCPKVV